MSDGLRLGRYRLLEKLASGGMAELFLARAEGEAGFARTCVVKRILPHLEEDPSFVQMFLDEARLAARLHHPGIVQIFELGRSGHNYYFAMEYLPGENWTAIGRQSFSRTAAIPLGVAARMARAAADALHYAHEARDEMGRPLDIIHRDVSPSNLLVTYQGLVKIVDFGIARAATSTTRTETGRVKGKTSYMAPEQALGKPVDRRVDVWALGVCLHELLTGQMLFRGSTTAEVALKVCQEEIAPPSMLRANVPPALDAVVMQALQRDPDTRFPTAAALRDALDEALASELRDSTGGDLAAYLEGLFGHERMEQRLRLLTLPFETPARRQRTVDIGSPDVAEAPDAAPPAGFALTVQGGSLRPTGRRKGWLAVGVVTLVMAVGGLGLSLRRTQEPVVHLTLQPEAAPHAASPPVSLQVSAPMSAPLSPSVSLRPTATVATALAPVPKHPRGPGRSPPPAHVRSSGASAAPTPKGQLTLVTQPYATVEWNSHSLGTTPLFDVALPAGRYTLRLRGPDGKRRRLPITVTGGALTTMRVRLEQLAAE